MPVAYSKSEQWAERMHKLDNMIKRKGTRDLRKKYATWRLEIGTDIWNLLESEAEALRQVRQLKRSKSCGTPVQKRG